MCNKCSTYHGEPVPKTFPIINPTSTTANDSKKHNKLSLKSNKLCGYDKISTKAPKSCLGYNSASYCYVCNKSMQVGAFPE